MKADGNITKCQNVARKAWIEFLDIVESLHADGRPCHDCLILSYNFFINQINNNLMEYIEQHWNEVQDNGSIRG